MDLFMLDTVGDTDLFKKSGKFKGEKFFGDKEEEENNNAEVNIEEQNTAPGTEAESAAHTKDLSQLIEETLAVERGNTKIDKKKKSARLFKDSMDWESTKVNKKNKNISVSEISMNDLDLRKDIVDKELQNIASTCVETKTNLSRPSARQLKMMKRKEREKTNGKDWFNMPATEVTEEIANDLQVLQMRSALDPKRFYKRNDIKVLPKYFQIGTVQHSPLDYYNERDARRNKKKTIVDELLADAEFQKYNKKKYNEIMERRHKTGYHKAMKKMKKLKKNK